MKAWKNFRYRLEYGLTLAAGGALRKFKLEKGQAFGRFLGRAAFHLGVARAAADENLALRLGITDPRERRAIARAAYANFGQTMAELAYMPALRTAELDDIFTFDGLDHLEAARAKGKGIVCMSAHYGNWEWMGAALIRKGFPVTFLIGTQSNPYVDRLFNDYRARVGIQFVRIQAIRDALRVLKMNGVVALLGDQDGDKWGTFVPFFGAAASTHSIGELLARRSGATLAFGVPVRLGPRRHHLDVRIVPAPEPGLSEVQASAWTLTEVNRLLEQAIRAHPDHWLWMHHRWHSQPFQRLSGEQRGRAEAGEIFFDMREQTWKESASGLAFVPEGWH
ncbi:MAG TPA: lysophospholipid acyltransferase family protein [bacterium]|jgi:KDO2-lipid IV(A) lauroyltransferase|nr:lysophospholipid acyltransferase family protein [bacterium]